MIPDTPADTPTISGNAEPKKVLDEETLARIYAENPNLADHPEEGASPFSILSVIMVVADLFG